MKTIAKVNSYVAWVDFPDSRSAYAQGIAESEEEFRSMCKEKRHRPYRLHRGTQQRECT